MYTLFYNLKNKPFAMNTDPSSMWTGEKQQEALTRLRRGIGETTGFQLVTGETGAGKTILLQALTARLDKDIVWAVIDDPRLERIDFYNAVAGKFGVRELFASKVQFLLQFSQFLHKAADEKKQVLLLIDECHLLPREMIEDLRLLGNIAKGGVALMHIIFFGCPECKELFMQPHNRAVMQRLTHVVELLPLNIMETGDYIRHRLKIAGTEEVLFTPQAVQMVHRHAKGNPRRINSLCDQAMAAGAVQAVKIIDAKCIAACVDSSTLGPVRQTRPLGGDGRALRPARGLVKYGLGLLVLCLVAIIFWWPKSDSLLGPRQVPPVNVEMPTVLSPPAAEVSPFKPLPPVMVFKDIEPAMNSPVKSTMRPSEAARITTPTATSPIVIETTDRSMEEKTAEVVAPSLVESLEVAAPVVADSVVAAPVVADSEEIQVERTTEKQTVEVTPIAPDRLRLPLRANSLELTAAARKELDGFVGQLEDFPQARLIVKGFVSSTENSPENIKLSEDRALHVQKILMDKGIAAERIEAVGMGNLEPLASNTTSTGRNKNRRVEVLVIHDDM
jgi:general secretion pathway protein A